MKLKFQIILFFTIYTSLVKAHEGGSIKAPQLVGVEIIDTSQIDENTSLQELIKLYSEKGQYLSLGEGQNKTHVFLRNIKSNQKGPKGEDLFVPQIVSIGPDQKLSLYKAFEQEGFEAGPESQVAMNLISIHDTKGQQIGAFSIYAKDGGYTLKAPAEAAKAPNLLLSLGPNDVSREFVKSSERIAFHRLMTMPLLVKK